MSGLLPTILISLLLSACSTSSPISDKESGASLTPTQLSSNEGKPTNSALDKYQALVRANRSNCTQLVHHKAFSLCYKEEVEQPLWVAHVLTRPMLNKLVDRTNDFRPDLRVKTGSAQLDDYRGSGLTRGHLVPAGDMRWDRQAMSETFLLSNVSPQLAAFNSGVWNQLEQSVRRWAQRDSFLLIITGPVFTSTATLTIGTDRVAVPSAFYKIVVDLHQPKIKAVAYLIPHIDNARSYTYYSTSINAVEEATGIDFFYTLEDGAEEELESRTDRF